MPDMTILVEPDFDMNANVFFYERCKEWAGQVHRHLNGGVSVKFMRRAFIYPTACFAWEGSEILRLVWRDNATMQKLPCRGETPVVTEENIWKEFLKPALREEFRKRIARLEERKQLLKNLGG